MRLRDRERKSLLSPTHAITRARLLSQLLADFRFESVMQMVDDPRVHLVNFFNSQRPLV